MTFLQVYMRHVMSDVWKSHFNKVIVIRNLLDEQHF